MAQGWIVMTGVPCISLSMIMGILLLGFFLYLGHTSQSDLDERASVSFSKVTPAECNLVFSIDDISAIYYHCRSLNETGFAATQKEDAVCDFLCSPCDAIDISAWAESSNDLDLPGRFMGAMDTAGFRTSIIGLVIGVSITPENLISCKPLETRS